MVSQSGELMHPGGVEERGNEEREREKMGQKKGRRWQEVNCSVVGARVFPLLTWPGENTAELQYCPPHYLVRAVARVEPIMLVFPPIILFHNSCPLFHLFFPIIPLIFQLSYLHTQNFHSNYIPYSSKFSRHKNFVKHSKFAKLLIFVLKIS